MCFSLIVNRANSTTFEELLRVRKTLLKTEVNTIVSAESNNTRRSLGSPRLLCWILTCPRNHKSKALAVKQTWGTRCDKLLFMSSKKDETLGSIGLPALEGRKELWNKTREAFQYIHKHYINEYDWFMKADDDTYVIVENLRSLLKLKNPDLPIFFGRKQRVPKKKIIYVSGGPGYVLSREAVNRLINDALGNNLCQRYYTGAEDVQISRCLMNANATIGNSRDTNGRHRFCARTPRDFSSFKHKFPKSPISFHYVHYNTMYQLEYFIYKAEINR